MINIKNVPNFLGTEYGKINILKKFRFIGEIKQLNCLDKEANKISEHGTDLSINKVNSTITTKNQIL